MASMLNNISFNIEAISVVSLLYVARTGEHPEELNLGILSTTKRTLGKKDSVKINDW